jgi:hypothetical protein
MLSPMLYEYEKIPTHMLLLLRPLISMGFENKSSQGTIYAYV